MATEVILAEAYVLNTMDAQSLNNQPASRHFILCS